MIKILFFARYREELEISQLEIERNNNQTIDDVRKLLANRNKTFAKIMNEEGLMVALNKELTNLETKIEDNDEIAFFPTVTGG